MQLDLEGLRITSRELENLTGLDISDAFMGRVFRPSVFHNPRRFLSFFLTELLTFGLILIFCLPLGLIIARNFSSLNTTGSILQFLLISGGISVAIAILWNVYMITKAKELKILGHLLDEVDKHNEIIQAVKVLDELGSVQHSTVSLIDRNSVISALQATRESLVCALMTEKILRKHQRFIARRQELFANIEANLAALQTINVTDQANEYSQLLNEALQIGMSVHQELRGL